MGGGWGAVFPGTAAGGVGGSVPSDPVNLPQVQCGVGSERPATQHAMPFPLRNLPILRWCASSSRCRARTTRPSWQRPRGWCTSRLRFESDFWIAMGLCDCLYKMCAHRVWFGCACERGVEMLATTAVRAAAGEARLLGLRGAFVATRHCPETGCAAISRRASLLHGRDVT